MRMFVKIFLGFFALCIVLGSLGNKSESTSNTSKKRDLVDESFDRMSAKCQKFEGGVTFNEKLRWANCMDDELQTEKYRWR